MNFVLKYRNFPYRFVADALADYQPMCFETRADAQYYIDTNRIGSLVYILENNSDSVQSEKKPSNKKIIKSSGELAELNYEIEAPSPETWKIEPVISSENKIY